MSDLISRSALLKSYDIAKMVEYDETGCGVTRIAIPVQAIKDAPAVDAVPVRHGEWRKVNVPKKWGGPTIRCSECNTGTSYMWNYCPNCGAKMDGGAEA